MSPLSCGVQPSMSMPQADRPFTSAASHSRWRYSPLKGTIVLALYDPNEFFCLIIKYRVRKLNVTRKWINWLFGQAQAVWQFFLFPGHV